MKYNIDDLKLIKKPPLVDMMDSIRSIGYSFNSALADIIDNSISANAKNIDIYLIPQKPAILIVDDGCGMTEEDLDNAMALGCKNPEKERRPDDLGRFGLGLKSASFSQCKNLTVTSKKKNDITSLTWDLNLVHEYGDWLLIKNDEADYMDFPYVQEFFKKNKSGTIVQWSDFDRIIISNNNLTLTLQQYLTEASKYLGLVFHKFKDKIKISINGIEIPKIDPFLKNKSEALRCCETQVKSKSGKSCNIIFKPYVLPFFKNLDAKDYEILGQSDNNKIRNEQGFYIYRNDRLIIWGDWLGLSPKNELYKNARVEVNIPNNIDDVWEIDVKKSNASIPGKIRNILRGFVDKSINESKKVCVHKGRKVSVGTIDEPWIVQDNDNSLNFKINTNNFLITQLMNNLSNKEKELLKIVFKDIERTIPRYDIYESIANTKYKKVTDDVENIKKDIKDLYILSSYNNEFLNNLFKCDPYCKYEDLKEVVLEEIKNGK